MFQVPGVQSRGWELVATGLLLLLLLLLYPGDGRDGCEMGAIPEEAAMDLGEEVTRQLDSR